MNAALTPEQEALREQARGFLAENPAPSWAELAELGWTGAAVPEEHGGAGLGFLEEAVLLEETGRALLHAPLRSTIALLPVLPADLQAEVARGESSWTLALGPLVSDLDTADRVAFVGGDGIFELEGAARELLETSDVTRPLGVVVGGEPGRRLAGSDLLPLVRRRSLAGLAMEACGAATRALELAGDTSLWAAWCVATDDAAAPVAAAAAKSLAADAAVTACERSIQAHGGIGFTWEHPLHRLYKRALWIHAWEASGEELRAEVAAALIDEGVVT